jgi:hypothetical protein
MVLYTVGLKATFWNMNSTVWVVWGAQSIKKQNQFEFLLATFLGGFFSFSWAKFLLSFIYNIVAFPLKSCLT